MKSRAIRHGAGRASGVLRYILAHPANRRSRARAVARSVRYQVKTGLLHRPYTARLGHKSRILVLPQHCEVESNIVYSGLPDWAEMQVWARYLRPGDLFIDVGASVGPYSLWAAELGAQGIAIEPSAFMLERLQRNIDLNGYAVEVVAAAVGERSGTGFSQLVGTGSDTVDFPTTRVVSIDDILGDRTAAGMKVDVEGAEILVLRGAQRALSEQRIQMIQLEWNNTSQYLRGEDREPVAALLQGYGYELRRPDPTGELVPLDGDLGFGADVFAVAGTPQD